MSAEFPMASAWVVNALREGLVIPAHPLALTSSHMLPLEFLIENGSPALLVKGIRSVRSGA